MSEGACGCDAEQTVAVLLEVLPAVIVEAAKDIHLAWLDGRQPDFSEEILRARLDRIVRERFPSKTSGAAGRRRRRVKEAKS